MRRFLLLTYTYGFCRDLVFLYPLYAIIFTDRGLSTSAISLLFIVWSVAAMLLEVPSGAIADRYPRKHVLIFALMVKMAGYTLWMVFPSFWGFLAGFVFWGTSSAFASGTMEAFVFDELKCLGEEEHYVKVAGRIESCRTAAVVVASFGATALVPFGTRVITLASLASLLAGCVSLALIRPVQCSVATGEKAYLLLIRDGFREVVESRLLLHIVLFISAALVFFGALDEYWTLFARAAGVSLGWIPVFAGTVYAVQIAGAMAARHFERLPERALYGAYTLSGLCVMAAAFLMKPASALLVLGFAGLSMVLLLVYQSRLQHAISGDARATVTSVAGFLGGVVGIALYAALGPSVDRWGYQASFLGCGALIVTIGLLYIVRKPAQGQG